jgi:hypothetical protein
MLKELARLNQELRVQKPYAPSAQEKRLEEDRNWSAAQRGQGFLKRGGGVGGGNLPDMGFGKVKNQRSPSDKSKSHGRKGIRDLIIDHLKSNIVS